MLHGGVFNPEIEIEVILRKVNISGTDEEINPFLWADPSNINNLEDRPKFSSDTVTKFLLRNKIDFLFRAHEFNNYGVEFSFIFLLSIFSHLFFFSI
jgi:hypothetical protein